MEITVKQLNAIEMIELTLDIKFEGTTKSEASTFIGNHMEESFQQAMENECNGYSLDI